MPTTRLKDHPLVTQWPPKGWRGEAGAAGSEQIDWNKARLKEVRFADVDESGGVAESSVLIQASVNTPDGRESVYTAEIPARDRGFLEHLSGKLEDWRGLSLEEIGEREITWEA
ncbi:MAG: hypothetical protein R3199_03505 [Gemmatimonadota bacterium]|nr:hypothetical protein [Gemmatimonadota bacterium]